MTVKIVFSKLRRRIKRILKDDPPQEQYLYNEDNICTPRNHDFVDDPNFLKAYKSATSMGYASKGPGSVHGRWNWHVLTFAAKHAASLNADIVQLGVFQGAEAAAMASYIEIEKLKIRMILCDTFIGVPEEQWTPTEIAAGADSAQHMYKEAGDNFTMVRDRFSHLSNVEVIQGTVPDVLPSIKSNKIGFLSLDLNCAAPEKEAAEYLWDRVVPGGIIMSDDYGHSREGVGFYEQKLAFDSFAKSKGHEVLALPTGQALIIKHAANKK